MFHHSKPAEPPQASIPVAPYLALIFALLAVAFLLLDSPFKFDSAREGVLHVTHGDPPNGTARIAVKIETNRDGAIARISLRDLDAAGTPKQFGTDLSKLKNELRRLQDALNGQPSKLIFEVGANLPYARVVDLLDLGAAAGFTNVVPVVCAERGVEIDVIGVPVAK